MKTTNSNFKVSHSVSLLVLGPLPGDTRWTCGVSRSLEVKRVEGEIPSRLLSTDPGVRPGKLSDVTGVLKMADGDTMGLVKAPGQESLTGQVASVVPTQWSVSRTTGLKTGRPVVTGAATRVEVLADLLEVAADAARWPVIEGCQNCCC